VNFEDAAKTPPIWNETRDSIVTAAAAPLQFPGIQNHVLEIVRGERGYRQDALRSSVSTQNESMASFDESEFVLDGA
jgi:hypothetical protein